MSLWSWAGDARTWNFRRSAEDVLARVADWRVAELLRPGRTRWIVGTSLAAAFGIALFWSARRAEPRIPYRIARGEGHGGAAMQGQREVALLEKLNRTDRAHLGQLGVLVVPERWRYDELSFSPLPPKYGWGEDKPKLIVVHQPSQAFGAYEWGRLVYWGPVSTGRRERPTPQGLYHLGWRSRQRHSTINEEWNLAWYFNFEERRGLAFHEYGLPGQPASYGCVRLLKRDAAWLYRWGEPRRAKTRRGGRTAGTPVLILGWYDFDDPPPWQYAASSAQKVKLPKQPAP